MGSRLLFAVALLALLAIAYLSAVAPTLGRIAGIVVVVAGSLSLIAAYRPPGPRASEAESWQATQPSTQPPPPLVQAAANGATLEFGDVLDALPVGVMVIGDDGKIRSFNAAAGELFGVPADRAANRALIEIVRNFELDKRVAATLRDGVEATAELAYSAAQERHLQVTTRPLTGAEGARSALVIVADETRMRELEKLRREFVSNVSHELRTPLTAVKLMVETLQTGVERPARDEFLGSIAQETERMIALVEDLLDLARLESGKLELRLGAVDVAALCRTAAQAQKQRAQSLGISLESSTPDAPITISADRDKLFQVIVNLLDNALRHTPAGGRVTLAATQSGDTVDIVVSDTGSGIPSTALPHIFERFYVVDPARARSRSGTGLGLAIVKHIIEAHGGTITATSELGVGTSFRCVFGRA
jgi:two-component system, OmpR family, phosphate regulon sensor histidine kinase PhoR